MRLLTIKPGAPNPAAPNPQVRYNKDYWKLIRNPLFPHR